MLNTETPGAWRQPRDRLTTGHAGATPRSHRRALRWGIGVAAAALVALLWAGIWFHLGTVRASEIAEAEGDARNLARTLEEHMLRTLTAIDQVLLRMRALYAEHEGPLDFEAAMPEAQGVLKLAVGAYVADADGRVVWSSIGIGYGSYIGDRDHFTVHARSSEDRLDISKPVTGRVSGRPSIQVTRRIMRRDGSFGGIVDVALDPAYLDSFYRSIDLGPHGTTTVFGLDGVVLARAAHGPTRVGQQLPDAPVMLAQRGAPDGLIRIDSVFDGQPKLVAYRRLAEYPIVVTVAIAEADVLADFVKERSAVVAAGLVLTALIGGLALLLLRQLTRIDETTGALAVSEERYALLIDGSREGMYDRDFTTNTIWFSERVHRFMGYPDGALNGAREAYLALIHPDDLATYDVDVNALIAAREPYLKTLFRLRHAGGSWRWIETRGRVVYAADGTPVRAVGSFGDITDRKTAQAALLESHRHVVEAEQALRRSEERYALAVDGMREGLFDRDFQTGTVWFSSRVHSILGLPDGSLNGARELFLSLIHPEDRGRYETSAHRAEAERHAHNAATLRLRRADGAWRWIAIRGSALYDEAGAVLRTVGSIGDITEQRLAEQALQDSEARFRALIEHSSDVCYIVSRSGTVLYRSPSAGKTFGHTDDEVIGQSAFARLHPDDMPSIAAALRAHGDGRHHQGTARLRHRDGSWRHVSWACSDATDIPGIEGMVFNVRDVTDAVTMEAQLRQAQKLEAVGRLAGGIAHDFNNILGTIVGFAGFLVEDLPAASAQRDYAERIAKASDRGKKLVEQILAFSRHGNVDREPTDLARIVNDMRELLAPSIPSSTRLEIATRGDDLVTKANVGEITQILLNLCLNANDALAGAPGLISVELVAVRPGDADYALFHGDGADADGRATWGSLSADRPYVRLSVSDTGPGMDAELLTRIFDPFFTTKEPGRGTGLGLSVVHGIVLSYGGAGSAVSRPGAGTAFAIYLPLVDAEPCGTPSAPSLCGGTGDVLLVDDDSNLADATAIALERRGYRVVIATDPHRAIATFAEAPARWAVVISDQTMPGMTGLTLHARLAAIRADLRFVLCTGFSDGAVEQAAHAAGIDAVFLKPVPTDRLVARIHEIVNGPVAASV
jgi:PAS domain S-box-containing protein